MNKLIGDLQEDSKARCAACRRGVVWAEIGNDWQCKIAEEKYLVELLWLSDLAVNAKTWTLGQKQNVSGKNESSSVFFFFFLEQGPAHMCNKEMPYAEIPVLVQPFFPVILESLIKAASKLFLRQYLRIPTFFFSGQTLETLQTTYHFFQLSNLSLKYSRKNIYLSQFSYI